MLRAVSFVAKLFERRPQPPPRSKGRIAKRFSEYDVAPMYPFVAIHLFALAGLVMTFMGKVGWEPWAAAFVLYWVRMWAVTAGYHRYFSHRTYKTSRVFQFILAFLAQTASQRGVLWWSAHHRDHHKFSDEERDVHSPAQHGFVHSHMGWLYDGNGKTDYSRVKDLARYPELVLLDKYWTVPPTILGISMWLWMGWPGLLVGFFLSTCVLMHCTFTINSLSHIWGKRRYETTDTSRNNWILALITLGEGWHNNHHHFMNSTRQGFFWWELDISYYSLKVLSWLGIVWDLKEPPARVYEGDLATPVDVPVPPTPEQREAA